MKEITETSDDKALAGSPLHTHFLGLGGASSFLMVQKTGVYRLRARKNSLVPSLGDLLQNVLSASD